MSGTEQARFGVVGRTLAHSWSPRIHAYFSDEPYARIELEPETLEDFIRHGAWQGLNVTIPYKRQAAELADVRSERVERLGVANTLVRRSDGTIFAENTDILGFAWMLERFYQRYFGCSAAQVLAEGEVLVLGSGGAAQAVVAALEDCAPESRVFIISRNGVDTYETLTRHHGSARLIVNATPVGMYPSCPATPVATEELEHLSELGAVLDVVYNPERTGICLAAERLGLPAQSGLAMLVAQASYSSELFLRTHHAPELIERITSELGREMRNICLIGMPGAGKTSTAKRLAHMLHRPYIDLDDAFEVEHGSSAGDFLAREGEKLFREHESRILARYGKESGLVIACGGGVVVREENYDLLHQNGTIVFLDRPLAELSSRGRPLSETRGIETLAAERMERYRSWADIELECLGSPERDAAQICTLLRLNNS